MLHGLVVGMRIRAHIAVMFDAPVDAVLRRTLGETRRGDPVDGHIRIVIQPGTIDIHIRRVDARTQCELGEHTFLAINRIDQQHGALRFDIVTNHFLTRELITPLRGIAIGGHQLAGMLINLQHGRQISHSGATEPPFRGNDALLTHLVHLCITLSSSERQKYHAHGTVFAICPKKDVQLHANQTRRRSNASELMPLARISLHHSFAVNRLWSR